MDLLRAHHWPGNVRELRNVMRRAALVKSDTAILDQLADSLRSENSSIMVSQISTGGGDTLDFAPGKQLPNRALRPGGVARSRSDERPERLSPDGSLRHRVKDHVRAIERDAVIGALDRAGGNKAEAARLLGIDYKTYRRKLKMLGGPDDLRLP
jgi:DNA-binding NtrC family response regulator